MLYQEMIDKVQKDLNIPHRRARDYISAFKKKYTGRKEAITAVKAFYNQKGEVVVSYIINGRSQSIQI